MGLLAYVNVLQTCVVYNMNFLHIWHVIVLPGNLISMCTLWQKCRLKLASLNTCFFHNKSHATEVSLECMGLLALNTCFIINHIRQSLSHMGLHEMISVALNTCFIINHVASPSFTLTKSLSSKHKWFITKNCPEFGVDFKMSQWLLALNTCFHNKSHYQSLSIRDTHMGLLALNTCFIINHINSFSQWSLSNGIICFEHMFHNKSH